MLFDQVAHEQSMIARRGARTAHRTLADSIAEKVLRYNRAGQPSLDETYRQVPVLISCQRHADIKTPNLRQSVPTSECCRTNGILHQQPRKVTRGWTPFETVFTESFQPARGKRKGWIGL